MKRVMHRWLIVLPALALLLASLNCTVNMGGTSDTGIGATQTALALQETSLALKLQSTQLNATATAQQAALNPVVPPVDNPPALPDLPTPDLAATQIAMAVAQTAIAAAGAATPIPPAVEITQPPVEQPAQPPQPPADLDSLMKNASILVYEDIVDDPSEYQYVKKTLQAMGLKYKWDGNALGWLKTDMLSQPGGKPWDLVIIASESRSEVSGEYFQYLNDVLNAGSSVILEGWHFDEIDQGMISPILSKCGVTVYPYFTSGINITDAVIWPISGAQSPLLQDPNSGLSFTKARDKWFFSFDLGSKMALTGSGDAQLLLGTNAQDNTQDGVLASCMGGRMTIQTFSSHTFPYSVMYPLWENYIYNALKVRFSDAG